MSNLFIWLHLQWQNVRQKYKYVFSSCESDKYITYLWQLLTSFYCGTYQHVKLPWVQILNGKTNHDYNEFSFCPNDLVISSVWTIILWKFLPFRIFRKSCPNFCHHLVQYCRILKHRPIWQKMDVHTIHKENVFLDLIRWTFLASAEGFFDSQKIINFDLEWPDNVYFLLT